MKINECRHYTDEIEIQNKIFFGEEVREVFEQQVMQVFLFEIFQKYFHRGSNKKVAVLDIRLGKSMLLG